MSDYDRSVNMHCPTCGGTQFEFDDEDDAKPVNCTDCGLEISREDLIQANGPHIEAQLDEAKEQIGKDLDKRLREAFRGNKYVKLK